MVVKNLPKLLPTKIFQGENYTAGLHMSTSNIALDYCTIHELSYQIKISKALLLKSNYSNCCVKYILIILHICKMQ